jgi:DNA topoisomerase-3
MNRRVLCVAEKNDAAKNVASFLSNGQYTVRKTKSKYNQLYIFDGQFRGATVTYVFTSVSGHLMKLEFEPVCKDWNSYPITGLFSARTIRSVDPSMKDIEATLRYSVFSILFGFK